MFSRREESNDVVIDMPLDEKLSESQLLLNQLEDINETIEAIRNLQKNRIHFFCLTKQIGFFY